jgi:hypothetical protein
MLPNLHHLAHHIILVAKSNVELPRLLFGWKPVDHIKETIASTMQFSGRASVGLPLCGGISSPIFPAAIWCKLTQEQ